MRLAIVHICAYNIICALRMGQGKESCQYRVNFADAVAVFEDPLALTMPDPESRGELRFIALGADASGGTLLLCSPSEGRVFD
jgi:uncharacterized DUF497 family protein